VEDKPQACCSTPPKENNAPTGNPAMHCGVVECLLFLGLHHSGNPSTSSSVSYWIQLFLLWRERNVFVPEKEMFLSKEDVRMNILCQTGGLIFLILYFLYLDGSNWWNLIKLGLISTLEFHVPVTYPL